MAEQSPAPEDRAQSDDAAQPHAGDASGPQHDDTGDAAIDALEHAQKAVDSIRSNGDDGPAATGDAEALNLPDFAGASAPADASRIDFLSDVHLRVKVELGRTRMYVEDVLRLNAGSVVELDKPAGDPVDVYVNERHVARGEVLVVNDSFCVRISEIVQAGGTHE